MTAAPQQRPCPSVDCFERHQQLLQELQQVVTEYQRMQTAQLAAVFNGANFPFEDWIAKAAVRMEQAKYAVIAHRKQHGLNCGDRRLLQGTAAHLQQR